jgi:hypothetical protein
METEARFEKLGRFTIGLAIVAFVRLIPEFLRFYRRGTLQPMYYGAAGTDLLMIALSLVAGLALVRRWSWAPSAGAVAWGALAANSTVFYWFFYQAAFGWRGHHLVLAPRVLQYAVTMLSIPEVVRVYIPWRGLPDRSELLIVGLVSAACSAILALSIIFLPTL